MKKFKNSRKAGINTRYNPSVSSKAATAGISLIALVITIIVLIILTGAVIATFMGGGIIDRAKESVFKNDMRTYQEILALKRAENKMEIALGKKEAEEINGTILADIQKIIPEFKEEYEGIVVITRGELSIGEKVNREELSTSEELYATWLSDLGIGLSRLPKNAIALAEGLEVGDYVSYIPDGEITIYQLLFEDSGYFINKEENVVIEEEIEFLDYNYNEGEEVEVQTITRQSINWRVLKNDGRQVTLISETPIDNIGLGNKQGFLNGPDLLDEIYGDLYSGSKGIARNLNIEDVNETMGIVIGEDVKQYYIEPSYQKVYLEAGATFGDAIDAEGYDVSSWSMPNDNYREYELDYIYEGSAYKERNEEIYKLIFRNVADNGDISGYWLSSTGASASFYSYAPECNFRMKNVGSREIRTYGMYDSYGDSRAHKLPARPIVILNYDVEVSNPTAGGDTVDTAWQLK